VQSGGSSEGLKGRTNTIMVGPIPCRLPWDGTQQNGGKGTEQRASNQSTRKKLRLLSSTG
jgi:hypothetical protein